MGKPEYLWRQLTPEDRAELIAWRKKNGNPWHSPPHSPHYGRKRFLISAACYEHGPYIGQSKKRMDDFAVELLSVFTANSCEVFAWCVLPNHYHALIEAPDVLALLKDIGQFHGRTSYLWNGEENARGRKVFFRAADRAMRSERHFWASLNYVHHNPVHHGYSDRWLDWPWSSAAE